VTPRGGRENAEAQCFTALGVLPMSLLAWNNQDDIRAAIEIGVREAFAHCSPDILTSFATAAGGEISPPDQPLKLSPAAERGVFDFLKRKESDPRLRVRRPVAMQMLGCGQSKLLELEDAGLIDTVMSGGARLIVVDSLYRLLIRDVVLSHPYGAPARKAAAPRAGFKAPPTFLVSKSQAPGATPPIRRVKSSTLATASTASTIHGIRP
jgi:hypothetical protein